MKLIVGLGNYKNKYLLTRHNIGFIVVDFFAKKHNFNFEKKDFGGIYYKGIINEEKVIIFKPIKSMNLSGLPTKKIADYFKIENKDILVIYDDLDQKFLNFKLKEKGTSGGHRGLENILKHFKTNKIKRLKIGIDKPRSGNISNYVLKKFSKEERIRIKEKERKLTSILDDFLTLDYNQVMSRHNKDGKSS